MVRKQCGYILVFQTQKSNTKQFYSLSRVFTMLILSISKPNQFTSGRRRRVFKWRGAAVHGAETFVAVRMWR